MEQEECATTDTGLSQEEKILMKILEAYGSTIIV